MKNRFRLTFHNRRQADRWCFNVAFFILMSSYIGGVFVAYVVAPYFNRFTYGSMTIALAGYASMSVYKWLQAGFEQARNDAQVVEAVEMNDGEITVYDNVRAVEFLPFRLRWEFTVDPPRPIAD